MEKDVEDTLKEINDALNDTKPVTDERLCSMCQEPISKSIPFGALRHFGDGSAHQEHDCIWLLQAKVRRARALLERCEDKEERDS